MKKLLILLTFFSTLSFAHTVTTPKGTYTPVFPDEGEGSTEISPLIVDKKPITNKEFLEFVKKKPSWVKSKANGLFVETTYLQLWDEDFKFKKEIENQPVVYVSWFAARAYCKAQNKRLPTIAEWEFFADTDSKDFEKKALEWYSQADEKLETAGAKIPNKYGVHDTGNHVWEWVEDFSSAIMAQDSRSQASHKDLFCAGAAVGVKDPSKYAAFIRYAMRASLKGKSTVATLGFRCVTDP